MADKEHMVTVHGKHHTFQVVKDRGGPFSATKYYVRRDDRPHRGSFSSLADAVRAAHEDAGPDAYEVE